MTLTNAERAKRHREKLRNVTRNGGNDVTKSNVTGGNEVTNSVTESNASFVGASSDDVYPQSEFKALWLAINGITERLDRIEAVQAKAVTLGVSVKAPHRTEKFANPFSRESQAHGRMPDNSPLGRMFREQNGG